MTYRVKKDYPLGKVREHLEPGPGGPGDVQKGRQSRCDDHGLAHGAELEPSLLACYIWDENRSYR